jgi:hypothetical protein
MTADAKRAGRFDPPVSLSCGLQRVVALHVASRTGIYSSRFEPDAASRLRVLPAHSEQ